MAEPVIDPTWDSDIAFLLSECVRFHEMKKATTLKDFIRKVSNADISEILDLSNGQQIICGAQALQRLRDRATRALRDSDASGTLQPERVYRVLKRI